MITSQHPARKRLTSVAIECFRRQTFPAADRELVILNSGEALNPSDLNIREVLIERPPDMTLGEMRNLALDLASGEWVIQWDDDDWHHEERCEAQMSVPDLAVNECVVLGSQIRHSLVSGEHFVHTNPGGQHGTILHHRSVPWRYPALNRKEDTQFLRQFVRRRIIRGRPELYCRFHHGANTWDMGHIMKPRGEDITLKPEVRQLLEHSILPLYEATESG